MVIIFVNKIREQHIQYIYMHNLFKENFELWLLSHTRDRMPLPFPLLILVLFNLFTTYNSAEWDFFECTELNPP